MFWTKRSMPSRSFYIVPAHSFRFTVSSGTSTYRNLSTSFYTVTSVPVKPVHSFSHSSLFRTKRPKPNRSFHIVPAHSLYFTGSRCTSTYRNLLTSFHTVTSRSGKTVVNFSADPVSSEWSGLCRAVRSILPAHSFHFPMSRGTST